MMLDDPLLNQQLQPPLPSPAYPPTPIASPFLHGAAAASLVGHGLQSILDDSMPSMSGVDTSSSSHDTSHSSNDFMHITPLRRGFASGMDSDVQTPVGGLRTPPRRSGRVSAALLGLSPSLGSAMDSGISMSAAAAAAAAAAPSIGSFLPPAPADNLSPGELSDKENPSSSSAAAAAAQSSTPRRTIRRALMPLPDYELGPVTANVTEGAAAAATHGQADRRAMSSYQQRLHDRLLGPH